MYVYAALAALAWSAVVVSLLNHAVGIGKLHTHRVALAQARTFFQQVVEVRSWNASHGGVYVEVADDVQPNPYLDVPERDIETTGGRKLTLINPAYMTRQIAERGLEKHGVAIHITSLNPIRPENAPSDWEKEALRAFEDGAREYAAFAEEGGRAAFRYMAPLAVEEGCLRCHEKQGYRLGDVRGGISVTIPDETLVSAGAVRLRQNLISALIIWLTGLGVIAATAVLFAQKSRMVEKLEELSLEDPLTGLRNRRGFVTLCAKELEIARRWGKSAVLLYMDVDSLKVINDTYGHAEGDVALKAIGQVIEASFREADVTARLGGDEFAAFCIEGSPGAAESIISHFRDKLEWEKHSTPREYKLSVSIGVAEFDPASDESLEKLMARADADMYGQKSRRRRSAAS
jgi:diguanylate cyclase (GGDEF)-like protein